MKIKSTLVILLGLLALSSTGAHAALKGLKGLSTAEAVASTEDGAESIDSKKLFASYVAQVVTINQAQISLAKAFDLQEQVQVLEKDNSVLSGKINNSGLEKITKNSAKVNEELTKKMAENTELSEEGKKHYRAASLSFAGSTIALGGVINSAVEASKNLSSKKDPKTLGAVKDLTFIANNGGAMLKQTNNVAAAMARYSKANKVEMPKDAQAELDALSLDN